MQTHSEKLSGEILDNQSSIEHNSKLMTAMHGQPSSYSWNGDIIDFGKGSDAKCACGHPIRYGFPLISEVFGDTVIVGSTCVNSAPGMPEGLVASMENAQDILKAKLAAAIKLEKEIKQNEQAAELSAKRDSLKSELVTIANELIAKRVRIDYTCWRVANRKVGFKAAGNYKRVGSFITQLKVDIEWLEKKVNGLKDGSLVGV